ncbi:MAG: GGDEF and EAL domain-containing protein [Bacteroides sp.]|nr:GGDEF and EAL domain-containing protein [Bacteroides sp.]
MNVLSSAFRETKCVNIRIDLTRDIPLTVLGKYHNLSKKDRRMNLREIIYAEDFPPLADVFSEIVSGRQGALNAHCRVNVGDDYHWVYLSCSVRKDTFNRTQHLEGTMMDVSEYLDTAENDFVLDGAAKKNRERIDAAMSSQAASLADILGEDYLLRIQQALTVNNGVSSAIYDDKGEPLVIPLNENGQIVSQKKFKHKISQEIRCSHRSMAVWTIACDDTTELAKTEPLLKVLAETVSQIANAILVLYNEMENSKTANQQLGSNIEQQILLNNIYAIILENNNANEALKTVIRLVGEYLKLDRVSLYDYDSETGYSALNTDWSAKGIEMKRLFKVEESPALMEELNYCDTFFSNGSLAEQENTGIKSFVVSQLSANGKFSGLVFYETIRKERIWSNADKKLLRNISQIISTMLIRCNMDAAIREQNERLKRLAFTDPVLGIPNRTCLDRDLSEQLEKGGDGVAISIKLTNVNTVNEAFGHIYSDNILQKIARYIYDINLCDKQVYRFSGSILMIIIKECGRDGAKDFLDNLLERFTRPWTVAGEEHYLEMNAGVAFYPRSTDNCSEVYRRSTLAMYRAMEEEKNTYAFYLEGSEEKAGVAYSAEQRLRHAVIDGMNGFSVKYLPVVDTEGRIVALEAGVNWIDGDNGEIPAAKVIALAESIGVDELIDSWVVNRSCAFLREIIDLSGRNDLIININLTSHELQRSEVHRTIMTAIEKHGLSGRNLAVEIPEKSQLKIGGDIGPVLNTLSDIGVKVIIDDFGREYMSLSGLKMGNVSKIKIRAEHFCSADEFDRAALRSVLDLAHKKNISVCVKHIESREQLEAVSKYDIDLLQGDYILSAFDGENTKKLFGAVEMTAVTAKLGAYNCKK